MTVGDLSFELCSLDQTVLATLDERNAGAVVSIGREVARTAQVSLDLDDEAARLASVGDTVLRCSAEGWSQPLFCGRITQLDISYDGASAELKITASDPLYHLESCLVFGTAGMSPAAQTFITFFAPADPSGMMWWLIATTADNGHGIVAGSLADAPDSALGFPAGQSVAEALRAISGLADAPEFELAPVFADDGSLVELNTYYTSQGRDRRDEVVLHLGLSDEADELLGFEISPSMAGFTNRHYVVGDAPEGSIAESTISGALKDYPLHLAYVADHDASQARYGVWETSESVSGASDASLLSSVARAQVAANADPVSSFKVTLDPDLAPSFGPDGDFWLGDYISVELTTPAENLLPYTGRVASASLTEAENGDVLVDLLLEFEGELAEVTGGTLNVVVDSAEGTDPPPPPPPEPDPCAPVADTGTPACPDAGSIGTTKKKKKKKKKGK
jgi:hypothetical protein